MPTGSSGVSEFRRLFKLSKAAFGPSPGRRPGTRWPPGKVICVKAGFDDHVFLVTEVLLPHGQVPPKSTHGFVIETFESPEKYEIEFDVDGDLILATVQLDDFRPPNDARSPVNVLGHPILNARLEVGDAGVSCAR
jgi:hypothetical protein